MKTQEPFTRFVVLDYGFQLSKRNALAENAGAFTFYYHSANRVGVPASKRELKVSHMRAKFQMNGDKFDATCLDGRRIVICEDEGVTVMQLRRALQFFGMALVGCEQSGDAGVTTVLRVKPDIVLMDIGLQGFDGIEATNRIMAEWSTCIVMLTGQSDGSRLADALSAGATGVLYKPVSSDLLLPQLVGAFQKYQAALRLAAD